VESYNELVKKKNNAAIFFMNLLRYQFGEQMNLSEILDHVNEKTFNPRVFTLIGIECKDIKYQKTWLQRALAKGDYLAYLVSGSILDSEINEKKKTSNLFTISKTTEFINLLECKKAMFEMELLLETKTFPDDFFGFFCTFYGATTQVRKLGLEYSMKVLETPDKFNDIVIESAHDFFRDNLLVNYSSHTKVSINDINTLIPFLLNKYELEDLQKLHEELYEKRQMKLFEKFSSF
jgi:hypothetical protein